MGKLRAECNLRAIMIYTYENITMKPLVYALVKKIKVYHSKT